MTKKYRLLRKVGYKGGLVYIRNIGQMFEYMIVYEGELYTNFVIVRPQWWRNLLFENPYTEKQEENTVQLLLGIANKTIDELIKKYNAR